MYYYDLHCHTSVSNDSPAKIEKIIEMAKNRGIDGIAVTDHNKTYKGQLEIKGIQIIPANEITTKEEVHLLAYFIKNDITSMMSIRETIFEVKKQGGYAVLAHPFRKGYEWIRKDGENKKEVEDTLKLFDGMESGNASDSKEERILASKIAKKLGIFETAGSDLHISSQVGFSYVIVREKLDSKNFKEVMEKAKIIVRPESKIFRNETYYWKKIVVRRAKSIGIYNVKFIKMIFFKLVLKNYLRIKDLKFKKINFNIKD